MTDDTILTNLARAQGKALGNMYLWVERMPRHRESLDYRRWKSQYDAMAGFLHDLIVTEKVIRSGFEY